jgi:hypothetical protein
MMAKMGKVSFPYTTGKLWYRPHSIVVCHARAARFFGIFMALSFSVSTVESPHTCHYHGKVHRGTLQAVSQPLSIVVTLLHKQFLVCRP